jgi:hypothetical protein
MRLIIFFLIFLVFWLLDMLVFSDGGVFFLVSEPPFLLSLSVCCSPDPFSKFSKLFSLSVLEESVVSLGLSKSTSWSLFGVFVISSMIYKLLSLPFKSVLELLSKSELSSRFGRVSVILLKLVLILPGPALYGIIVCGLGMFRYLAIRFISDGDLLACLSAAHG